MKRGVGIIGLVLLIGAAAAGVLFGLSRLTAPPAAAQEGKREQVMVIAVEEVVNGERFGGQVRITFADPAEVPVAAEDASGLFLGRLGDEVTLGTGAIEVEKSVEVINDQEPTSSVSASHDGAEVNFVVDGDTVYYKDATEIPVITKEMVASGSLELVRKLEPGNLDEIGQNMIVRAWGETENGLLQADLVIYDPIE